MNDSSSWSCSHCTLENPNRRRRCDACGIRRMIEDAPTPTKKRPRTNSANDSGQQQQQKHIRVRLRVGRRLQSNGLLALLEDDYPWWQQQLHPTEHSISSPCIIQTTTAAVSTVDLSCTLLVHSPATKLQRDPMESHPTDDSSPVRQQADGEAIDETGSDDSRLPLDDTVTSIRSDTVRSSKKCATAGKDTLPGSPDLHDQETEVPTKEHLPSLSPQGAQRNPPADDPSGAQQEDTTVAMSPATHDYFVPSQGSITFHYTPPSQEDPCHSSSPNQSQSNSHQSITVCIEQVDSKDASHTPPLCVDSNLLAVTNESSTPLQHMATSDDVRRCCDDNVNSLAPDSRNQQRTESRQFERLENNLRGEAGSPLETKVDTANVQVSFTTAGSNSTIQIQEASLQKANQILHASGNLGDESVLPPLRGAATFSVAASTFEKLHLVSLAKPNEHSNICVTAPKNTSTDGDVQSFPLFKTAGSKSAIRVDEASLRVANDIFCQIGSRSNLDAYVIAPTNARPVVRNILNVGSRRSVSCHGPSTSFSRGAVHSPTQSAKTSPFDPTKLPIAEEKPGARSPVPCAPDSDYPLPPVAFQTAGTKRSVVVSTERLEAADRLLNAHDSLARGQTRSLPFQTSGNRRNALVTVCRSLDTPNPSKTIPIPPTHFQAKRTKINVVQSVEKLDASHSNSGPSTKVFFQSAGTNKSIAVSNDELGIAGRVLDAPGFSKFCPIQHVSFQTAGTKRSVVVSEDKLKAAGRLLDAPYSKSGSPDTTSLSIAEIKRKVFVSEEKQKTAGRLLDATASNNGQALLAAFQAAGSKRMQSISKGKLEAAHGLLSAPQSSESCPKMSGREAAVGKKLSTSNADVEVHDRFLCTSDFSCSPRVPFTSRVGYTRKTPSRSMIRSDANDCERGSFVPSFVPVAFQRAGTQSTVVVSEEKLQAAGRLIKEWNSSDCTPSPDTTFQSAGTKRTLSVSRDKLEAASRLLQESDSGGRPKELVSLVQICMTNKDTALAKGLQTPGCVGKRNEFSARESLECSTISGRSSPNTIAIHGVPTRDDAAHHTSQALKPVVTPRLAPSRIEKAQNIFSRTKNGHWVGSVSNSADRTDINPWRQPSATPGSPSRKPRHHANKSISSLPAVTPSTSSPSPLCGNEYRTHRSEQSSASVAKATFQDTRMTANINSRLLGSECAATCTQEHRLGFGEPTLDCGDANTTSLSVDGRDGELPKTSRITTLPPMCTSSTIGKAFRRGELCSDSKECSRNGVRDTTLRIDSWNAVNVCFDRTSGYPSSFGSPVKRNAIQSVGTVKDFRQSLLQCGCDVKQISDAWILNHMRWIIWMLASYERSFCSQLGGRYLTYQRALRKLEARFRREICRGSRPATRMILNRDASVSRPMVLCVSRVQRQEKKLKAADNGSVPALELELTDGWYAIDAKLDSHLAMFVKQGTIRVGTKIFVASCRLVGGEEGIDPLDDDYTSPDSVQRPYIALQANTTRLAKWNCKLGFVKPRQAVKGKGAIIKKISDILPGGGDIHIMRMLVLRRYPKMYVERSPGGPKYPLSEAEEHQRQLAFENRRLLAVEKISDHVKRDVEEEIDESAPDVWRKYGGREMSVLDSMEEDEKLVFEAWTRKRRDLLRLRVQQEIQAELETDDTLVRHSTSFIRVRVRSIDSTGIRFEQALLTIWDPTEEQLGQVTEGEGIECHELGVKAMKYNGLLQLSGNSRMLLRTFDGGETKNCDKAASEFQLGETQTIFQLHALSHRISRMDSPTVNDFPEIDTCGVIVGKFEVSANKSRDIHIFLTDKSQLLLRLHVERLPFELKTMIRLGLVPSEGISSKPIVLHNLQLLSFDHAIGCAVARFCSTSSMTQSHLDLNDFDLRRNELKISLCRAAKYVRSQLRLHSYSPDNAAHIFGYVVRTRPWLGEDLLVEVDCGGSIEVLILPCFLRETLHKDHTNDPTRTPPAGQPQALCGMTPSALSIAKRNLWRFKVGSSPSNLAGDSSLRSILDVGKADLYTLASLHTYRN